MKHLLMAILATGVVAASALTARTLTQAAPVSAATRTPVIVELFTSEGCSSCPPADALLRRFEKTPPVPGAQVIALGEHVDYWNRGGWADRFSSAGFSERQSDYSRAFGLDQVYTPQMIVDGRAQFNGSDEDTAREAIARAARQPKADVQVTRAGANALSVRVDRLPDEVRNGPADIVLAITEDGLSSSIGSGENAGRHLQHAAVVRHLTILGTTAGGAFTAAPTVKTGGGRVHAVVFVQERRSRLIVGAAQADLQ